MINYLTVNKSQVSEKYEIKSKNYHVSLCKTFTQFRFSKIKGLDLKNFKNQLEYLEKNYEVITHKDVIDALNDNKQLPKKFGLAYF